MRINWFAPSIDRVALLSDRSFLSSSTDRATIDRWRSIKQSSTAALHTELCNQCSFAYRPRSADNRHQRRAIYRRWIAVGRQLKSIYATIDQLRRVHGCAKKHLPTAQRDRTIAQLHETLISENDARQSHNYVAPSDMHHVPYLWNQLPSPFHQRHCVYSPPGSPHPAHNHLIIATTFALITYHSLDLSLQT